MSWLDCEVSGAKITARLGKTKLSSFVQIQCTRSACRKKYGRKKRLVELQRSHID